MTKIQTPRPPGAMATTREIAAWIEETYHWQAEVSRMLNGGVDGTAQLAADKVQLVDATGTPQPGLEYEAGGTRLKGNWDGGKVIFLQGGSSDSWPGGLETRLVFMADGDSVALGTDFGGAYPEPAALPVGYLAQPDYAAGETYALAFTNLDGTGFTASFKIATLGAPTAVTESTNAVSPPGPAHMVARADSNTPYGGQFSFTVQGTVDILDLGFGWRAGTTSMDTYFHDGSGWVLGPTITFVDQNNLAVGTHAFAATLACAFTGTVRSDATLGCFGVSLRSGSGGSVTDLVSVGYTYRSEGSPTTASPNGEECPVLITFRNIP